MTVTSSLVTNFTPLRGVIGGILIGCAAAILLLGNGNIFGASGITSSLFLRPGKTTRDTTQQWKIVFMACFFIVSSTLALPAIGLANDERMATDETVPIPSVAANIIGGFFVSFGTALGSGCTTGHGVCGMARLSKRSIVAVMTFMCFAMGTAMLTSPTTSFASAFNFLRTDNHEFVFEPRQLVWLGWILTGLMTLWAMYTVLRKPSEEEQTLVDSNSTNNAASAPNKTAIPNGGGDTTTNEEEAASHTAAEESADGTSPTTPTTTETPSQPVHQRRKLMLAGIAGVLFSAGLAISGMNLQSKNYAFLDLVKIPSGLWDPTLLCVMAAAMITSWISYQFVPNYTFFGNRVKTIECPIAGGKYDIPTKTQIDIPLLAGGACFGIGWGIAGLCPGPGIFMSAAGIQIVVYCYLPSYIIGGYVANFIKQRL